MNIVEELAVKNEKKIVLLVMDGLGGLPMTKGGKTELETARTPVMDALAVESECGLQTPLGIGITPGSAPGHFSLFGYNAFDYAIGRGVVAAMGINFPMNAGDVAARINFASKDKNGNITDRRAGRIPTEKCAELCDMLKDIRIEGVTVSVKPVKDYRAVAVFKGKGLSDKVEDTDPQATGVRALDPKASAEEGRKMAQVVKEFVSQVNEILKNSKPANTVLMRGFAELPHIPSMSDRYKLTPAALAVYPDYKGVSRLVGMDVVDGLSTLADQAKALKENWDKYDFFFVHHKYTDSKGEDGNFNAKVKEIEKVDAFLPELLKLNPDVLIITGDHSTPAFLKSHSGHPVPFLIHADDIRPDDVSHFGERSCAKGLWSNIPGEMLIRLALSYSGKLKKYGA